MSSHTRRKIRYGVFVVCACLVVTASVAAEPFADRYIGPIEEAHGLETWSAQRAIEADVVIDFGSPLVGKMTFTVDGKHSRMDLADGTVLVFDGSQAWVSPSSAELNRARFHLLTWPYFLAAPMKLRDPGTHLEDLGQRPLTEGHSLPAARLTFDASIGDTPEDWYILYRDADNRLVSMAYIVTYGKSVEKAEANPHAVIYHDFETLDGVTLSTDWDFKNWSLERGAYGDSIGHVKLEHLRFVETDPGMFSRPRDARNDPLPGS